MQDMGKTFQSSTEKLIESYNDTINTINELHTNFTDKLMKHIEDTDKTNKDQVTKTEKSHYEQGQDISKKTKEMKEKFERIYDKCEGWTSVLTLGFVDGCAGKQAPNVKVPKTFKLDMGNLANSLDPILKYVGDEKERDKMGACGNHTYKFHNCN